MRQKTQYVISIISILLVIYLSSCTNGIHDEMENVGMLIDHTLQEEWDESGRKGLQLIEEKFDANVFVKENVQSKHELINAVEELKNEGVNLIFGHSSRYGKLLVDVAKLYPQIHFVYFNGEYIRDNVTSLHLNSHAMAFFSGMIAGKMTKTNHVGIIAAYEWIPEIEGFYEGVKYENPETSVHIDYMNEWREDEVVLDIYNNMKESQADVFYPAGYSYSKEIVEHALKDNLYSIGYFPQTSNYSDPLILTSTIQHIESLYVEIAEKFNDQMLEGGIYVYDLADEIIMLDSFSELIPEQYQELIQGDISEYKETNLLPHEK